MPDANVYKAGVCNIGPEERAKRRQAGYIGLAVLLVLWVLLVYFHVPRLWRLVLFFPAFMSAIGFIQARLMFCVHFGLSGLFNFGPVGKTESVYEAKFRELDRKMSWKLIGYAAAIAVVVTGVGMVLF